MSCAISQKMKLVFCSLFRAFIRFYMDESGEKQPERYHELVKVHGKLVPLVNVNLKPDTHVRVQVG